MAIALVQQVSSIVAGGTTGQLAFSSNNTGGNLLIAGVFIYGNDGTIGVTDSVGNGTWLFAQAQVTTWGVVNVFYVPNCLSGANTPKVTPFTSGGEIHLSEWSGVATSSPLDKTASNGAASGTAITSGSVTTVANGELIYSMCGSASGQTAGSGFTQISNPGGGNITQYQIQTSAGSIAATETQGASGAWGIVMNTFLAAAAVTAARQRLALLGVGT